MKPGKMLPLAAFLVLAHITSTYGTCSIIKEKCSSNSECCDNYCHNEKCTHNVKYQQPQSCKNLTCEEGQSCYQGFVNCIRAPCPQPTPMCVAHTSTTCEQLQCSANQICYQDQMRLPVPPAICIEKTCGDLTCPQGQMCYDSTVYCRTYPCPPPAGYCGPENITSCEQVTCPNGSNCYEHFVNCLREPCMKVPPNCVTIHQKTCDDISCGDGEVCHQERVNCAREPCLHPAPYCRAVTSTPTNNNGAAQN